MPCCSRVWSRPGTIQPATVGLLERLCAASYDVLLETNGTIDIRPVPRCVTRIVDVKTPASGMAEHNLWHNLTCVTNKDEVKFVLCDRRDYEWAGDIVRQYELAVRTTVLFSPARRRLAARRLAGWILDDRLDVRLNLQWHRVLWPERDRGV